MAGRGRAAGRLRLHVHELHDHAQGRVTRAHHRRQREPECRNCEKCGNMWGHSHIARADARARVRQAGIFRLLAVHLRRTSSRKKSEKMELDEILVWSFVATVRSFGGAQLVRMVTTFVHAYQKRISYRIFIPFSLSLLAVSIDTTLPPTRKKKVKTTTNLLPPALAPSSRAASRSRRGCSATPARTHSIMSRVARRRTER